MGALPTSASYSRSKRNSSQRRHHNTSRSVKAVTARHGPALALTLTPLPRVCCSGRGQLIGDIFHLACAKTSSEPESAALLKPPEPLGAQRTWGRQFPVTVGCLGNGLQNRGYNLHHAAASDNSLVVHGRFPALGSAFCPGHARAGTCPAIDAGLVP